MTTTEGQKCNHQMFAEKLLKNVLKPLNNYEEGILCFWLIPEYSYLISPSLPFLYCHHQTQMETPADVLSISNPGWFPLQGVQVGEELGCLQV